MWAGGCRRLPAETGACVCGRRSLTGKIRGSTVDIPDHISTQFRHNGSGVARGDLTFGSSETGHDTMQTNRQVRDARPIQ